MIPLVAVAHGSRDPRSAATVRALVDRIAAAAPELDVRVSFLDLSEPLVTDVLRDLVRAGHREAVVVPLLLGSAFHARVDLPALVAEVPALRVTIADVLGADLEPVAFDRLAAVADVSDPGLGVVLAAVGSSRAAANEAVAALARRWQSRHGFRAVAAFASAAKPDVPAAVAKLRARGASRIAVASWFLAPGLLPDRIAALAREAEPSVALADCLAGDPRVASLVLERYATALAGAARSA
ncbi:sirohydrochlorin chelatase [Amycolatopsis tucumanensis]|uniref:Sirohydrochlorin chelatase n=1 Tax=Amycolatopsis tucumanensis TaxID=401106 RepID=A0ABP7JMU9_9PSEU|nr:CbiX/SirB N-terminal domain-containing protein [Amycolatopsis tucumanensis]MCF6424570.1 sirohydrochlorin chelatase [Amycolatopsis tucumanensis]